MAQHVDQPVNISTIDLSFSPCTNHTSFSDSCLGVIDTVQDIVNTSKDLD